MRLVAEPAPGACCRALDSLFDGRMVRLDLRTYRSSGPSGTTRRLVEAIRAQGVDGATLLDIGGGVGAIQHELLAAGVASATSIDASRAYLAAAREEAERRGTADRLVQRHGDFVALAPELAPADVVTLERVVCCYPDVDALVTASAALAVRLYGLVYPRPAWWTQLGGAAINLAMRIRRSGFRFFVHPEDRVDALARAQGLTPLRVHRGLLWTVAIYRRG